MRGALFRTTGALQKTYKKTRLCLTIMPCVSRIKGLVSADALDGSKRHFGVVRETMTGMTISRRK